MRFKNEHLSIDADQKVYIYIKIQNDYQKNAKIQRSRFSPLTIDLEITWKRG